MPRKVDHLRSIPVPVAERLSNEHEFERTAIFLKDTDPKENIFQLNLHGIKNPDEAVSKIRQFVLDARLKGGKVCRIIHGIGTRFLEELTIKELQIFVNQGVVKEFLNSQHNKYRLSAKLVLLNEQVK